MCASRPCFGAQSQFSAATADVHGLQGLRPVSRNFHHAGRRWGAGAVRIFVFVTPMVLRPSEIPAKTEKTHRDRQEKYICSYLETGPLRPLTKNTQKSSKSSKIIEISRVYNFSTACSIRDPINTFLGVPGRHRPSWIGGSSTKIDEITIFFW